MRKSVWKIGNNICVVGHRGACGYAPENTLSSFQKAIDIRCCRTELDVRLSKDDVPVVIHDDTVDRTTDGSGRVSELNASELQALECEQGEHIPTLDDVITLCKDRIPLQIELKEPAVVTEVAKLISAHGIEDVVVFSSFDDEALQRMRRLLSNVPFLRLSKTVDDMFWNSIQKLKPEYVGLKESAITPEVVQRMEAAEVFLYAFHVIEKGRGEELINSGVRQIGTPYPKLFLDNV